MPLDDVAWVLEQAHRFCDQHGLGFGAYPMHELAAHPHAAELLRLFAERVGAAEFEPLSTTGVPLAVREDWRQLLATAAKLGTTTVWVASHGVGTEHDRQVNRTDAWTETCLAVQRVHAAGLRAGANVFLTTANAPQAERLLGVLQRLQLETARCWSWCAAPTSTCTPAWQAGTSSGTVTCAPAIRRRSSTARSRKAAAPSTRCGLAPTRCRRSPSWPPDMATAVGKESTSARTQPAIYGWTAHGRPDGNRPRLYWRLGSD
jgi:hypothetical protein